MLSATCSIVASGPSRRARARHAPRALADAWHVPERAAEAAARDPQRRRARVPRRQGVSSLRSSSRRGGLRRLYGFRLANAAAAASPPGRAAAARRTPPGGCPGVLLGDLVLLAARPRWTRRTRRTVAQVRGRCPSWRSWLRPDPPPPHRALAVAARLRLRLMPLQRLLVQPARRGRLVPPSLTAERLRLPTCTNR